MRGAGLRELEGRGKRQLPGHSTEVQVQERSAKAKGIRKQIQAH